MVFLMPWKKTLPLLATAAALHEVFLRQREGEPAIAVTYEIVAAFDYGRIQSSGFLAALQCMAKGINARELLVAAIDSDPINHFWHQFGVVPAFDISPDTTEKEFTSNLHWAPEGWGDSIACVADEIVIVDDNISMVILGEARFEIVRLFVRKDIVSLNLQECLPVDWRYDRANIEECLLDCGVDSISAHLFANQLIDTEE
jgi:hypothetical protein